MNKVEGKVSDFCPKCKNCKGMTRESNGVHVWLTEVECEDPYDGMTKTLDADSNICCSMFEEKDDILAKDIEIKSLQAKYEDAMSGWNHTMELHDKLKQESDNLAESNEKLEDKCHKLERRFLEENKRFARLDSEFFIPLVHVLYPGEKVCKPYSEILKDIKLLNKGTYDLKEDNKRLVDKNKELEKRYHKAETDITILNSKVEVLDRRNTNQCVMIGERDKEIENLKKMVERRDRWVKELQSDVYSLQNEILTIRNIAQKAYDDTNRD